MEVADEVTLRRAWGPLCGRCGGGGRGRGSSAARDGGLGLSVSFSAQPSVSARKRSCPRCAHRPETFRVLSFPHCSECEFYSEDPSFV